VAVKAFRLDITPEQARELAAQLQRCADADLDHPSIVRLLAAGVEGSLAYTASEYVAAESLDIALRHYAPAGLEMVLPFITQLAGAVDFARAAGIGHGALHPRDIFVTPDEARATGFGVVQALEAIGIRAPVRRPYTAPERVDGGSWDIAADVYSLAAIAYELLTAKRPVGSDIGGLGSNAGPHAEDIARVLSRALSDDPSLRYPSALALAAALEASSRGERTTKAIEEVSAVAGASFAAAEGADSTAEVHDLTIVPDQVEHFDEPEADVADIQLRSEPPPARDWEEVASREHEADRPLSEARRDEETSPEPSLFEVDRDDEDGIPEVQHSGFQPGVLEPGYQSEPPPPEGWDEHPPVAALSDADQDRSPGVRPQPSADRRRSVVIPVAVTLLLGLFVGFLAGYLVFVRDGSSTGGGVSSVSPGSTSSQPASKPETPPQTAPASTRPAERRGEPGTSKPSAGSPAPRATETSRAPAERPRPTTTTTTAPRGRMVVRSNPSGAVVFINGRRRGITPLALRDLAPGTYTVRLSRDGFADASQRVSVSGSSVREVSLRLARRTPPRPTSFTGSLYVDSRPRGARVLLDGKEVGVTPMQLGDVRAGAHVVRLELTDHRTWTASARVVAGQTVRVTGSLERMR
jgi:serine/threonine protein kinase